MDTSNLKLINDAKAEKALLDNNHQELLSSAINVSNTVLSATASLIKYLEGHTSKTQVVNQLKSINTPDALRVIPFLEKLDETLKTHKNTDLTEITAVMKNILDEAKKIPKELPAEKEERFIDYTSQLKSLGEAIKSVEKVVKAQKLIAEAPIVNVPQTKVNVEAPNLKPLQDDIKDVVKAVNGIVIPEYKTDNTAVEELIRKSNKLLKELVDKPISQGGGGGGRATPYQDSTGIPAFPNTAVSTATPTITAVTVVNPDGSNIASGTTSSTATASDIFNSAITGSRYNQIEIDFATTAPASITDITVTNTLGGSSSNLSGQAKFTSGTNTSGGVKAVTILNVTYRPHAEIYAAFTAIFTTGIANSYQRIGLYDASNGFFIGYEGTSFGITKRSGGTDTTTAQASFNTDTLTGGSTSLYTRNGTPEALDTTKDNLYRIRYGWLGAAQILFEVYSPDGTWVVFHKLRIPNSQTVPSIQNPNLPLTLDIQKSTAGATELIMNTACWAAGTTSNFQKVTDTITDNTLAALSRSVITGKTSAGGGNYVNVKVNPSGALVTDATGSSIDIKNSQVIKFASVSISASGDNAIVAAVASKKIKVLSCTLVSSGTVSVKWRSGTTDLSGAMPLVANSGFVLPASAPGQGHYLETAVNTALNINLSGAVQVSGLISYYEEA